MLKNVLEHVRNPILLLEQTKKFSKFVRMTVDPRLLKWLLLGPAFAHWNNAEIGSHITYERNPNIFERGLFYCMNFFHR